MKNIDKIKAMNIDEMAKFFDELNINCTDLNCPAQYFCDLLEDVENCVKPFKMWLEKEED